MAWIEQHIESWGQFNGDVLERHVAETTPLTPTFLYRGQSVAGWDLSPGLARICAAVGIDRAAAIQLELRLLQRFKARAHLFLDTRVLPTGFGTLLTPESSAFEWWTLMQHYGGPTRILDWTLSPLVGLYFAVRHHWHKDGALWFIHGIGLTVECDQRFGREPASDADLWRSPDPPRRVLVRSPSRPTDRMISQQGAFTVSQDVLADHATAIAEVLKGSATAEQLHRKYTIPARAKRSLLRQLHNMNVTAATLFPGIDGLGAELEELARL